MKNSKIISESASPKVSVIMPSLNVGAYIRECIESVVNQTLTEIEIICVDAGSTDGTIEILQEYAEKDNRIKIIHSDRRSYGYQMNCGIQSATGEYIGIVETDDYIKPEMYNRLYQVAVRENVDLIKSDFNRFWTPEGMPIKVEYTAIGIKSIYKKVLSPICQPELMDINMINPTGLFRRSFIIKESIFFNETPGASFQDNGFWFKTFCLAERAYFIPEAFYMVRRDNPASSIKDPTKVYCMCDEYSFIFDFLNRNPEKIELYKHQYVKKCFGNYVFILNLIQPEFKKEFLCRFSSDFNRFKHMNFFDEKNFSKQNWKFLSSLMKDPIAHYYTTEDKKNNDADLNKELTREIAILRQKIKDEKQENMLIRTSWTYRIGFMITAIPRKIRGGLRCYTEHGMDYTVKRCIVHLRGTSKKSVDVIESVPHEVKKVIIEPPKNIKKDYAYFEQLPYEMYEEELCSWYKRVLKKDLDLNNPTTFNEKMQWLKLYDSTAMKTRLADKYLVRDWVGEKIGKKYLIPLLGAWNSFDEIDFSDLPDQIALKTNHGSGWNLIVQDKSKLDKRAAKEKFDIWMSKNYAFGWGFELHYMNIPPKIIAEQYISDLDGDILDYRFFCFNGEVKYVWVDLGSGTTHHKRNIYDLDWNLQNYRVNYPLISPEPEKPDNFNEMISLAKILSEGFAMVRVDFYSIGANIYFGEMTFTPQSGTGTWESEAQNKHYGDLIRLPAKSEIPRKPFQ